MAEMREGYEKELQGEEGAPEQEDLSTRMRAGMQRVQDEVRRADERIRSFVDERPLTAVAIALGTGFLLGKLLSRQRGTGHD